MISSLPRFWYFVLFPDLSYVILCDPFLFMACYICKIWSDMYNIWVHIFFLTAILMNYPMPACMRLTAYVFHFLSVLQSKQARCIYFPCCDFIAWQPAYDPLHTIYRPCLWSEMRMFRIIMCNTIWRMMMYLSPLWLMVTEPVIWFIISELQTYPKWLHLYFIGSEIFSCRRFPRICMFNIVSA